MVNSMTEVYSPINNLGANSDIAKNKSKDNIKRKRPILAMKFKYQINFPSEDIEVVRKLLTFERSNQNEDEFKFWTSDYERLMCDDWLVTRFLLRGLKASQRESRSGSQQITVLTTTTATTKICDTLAYARTIDLIRSCANFRLAYRINGLTESSEFPAEWIETNGLFKYKPDLAGNPTIYLRIKIHKPKLIESKELRHQFKRLLLYTLELGDRDLAGDKGVGKGICCVFDMSCATLENVDLELMSWMVKSFKSCSPKLLCCIIIYNLPWFFSATFRLIANTLMSNSNKQYLKFVYGDEILSYIGQENLPKYLRANVLS